MTIPTVDEIVERIEERQPKDPFGFEWKEYPIYLPFEKAKPYLQDTVKPEDWTDPPEQSRSAIVQMMLDYMAFAWGKANDCRGISSNRSVMHYVAWTWLAGDRDFSAQIDEMFRENYCYYGKPILWLICQKYGWDFRKWDDDDWTINEGQTGPAADRVIDGLDLQDITIA